MSEETYIPPTVVPWVKVDGVEVHTNGVMEEALGLSPFMCGWNTEGFYSHTPEHLKARLEQINWTRVAAVTNTFDIKADGYVAVTDTPKIWITERRFVRLLKRCMVGLSQDVFDREVAEARRVGSLGTVSGNLE